ncbi:MAG: hypothetical protein NT166_31625 [Candidatus Aminicenantes bacterium]|nr:hypothetical protein [Candidatus Aminicenantes bacterium]
MLTEYPHIYNVYKIAVVQMNYCYCYNKPTLPIVRVPTEYEYQQIHSGYMIGVVHKNFHENNSIGPSYENQSYT